MKHTPITRILLTALCLLSSVAWASTTWYVNGVTGSDSNNCLSPQTACKTIGHAVSLASSGDSIMVAAATYTENLIIGISLNILGAGTSTTIIDGRRANSVVTISGTGVHVTLSRFTIQHGSANRGGGIANFAALTVKESTIRANEAHPMCFIPLCYAGLGSAIFSRGGALTVIGSTIKGNTGAAFGSIALWDVRARIFDSTISGNNDGIFHTATSGDGTLNVINNTIAGNSSTGIENLGGTVNVSNSTIAGNVVGIYDSSVTMLQNSIVANNSGGNCFGAITSNGFNLSSDGSCPCTNTGDLNNTDPKLGPLQNNGGPTQTMALQSGSPAIDGGNPAGCTDGLGNLLKTDQRGMPRPDTEDKVGCDMGAYERQSD